MRVVSDSSPLITLARTGRLDLLEKVFPRVYISTEVYDEVVNKGAGLPGAEQVAQAEWIEVVNSRNSIAIAGLMEQKGL